MSYRFVARPGSPTPGPQRDLTDEEAARFHVTDSPAYEYVSEGETSLTIEDVVEPLMEGIRGDADVESEED